MATTDNMYAMVGIFASAIVILILAVVWSNFSSVDFLWSQDDVGGKIKSDTQSFVDNWDFIMFCLYVGTHLSILALSYLLRTHPVVYIAAIFLTVLLVIVAAPLSNAYEDIIVDPTFSAVAGDYTKLNYIMAHLPFLELIWAMLTIILLYGFARSEGVV